MTGLLEDLGRCIIINKFQTTKSFCPFVLASFVLWKVFVFNLWCSLLRGWIMQLGLVTT